MLLANVQNLISHYTRWVVSGDYFKFTLIHQTRFSPSIHKSNYVHPHVPVKIFTISSAACTSSDWSCHVDAQPYACGLKQKAWGPSLPRSLGRIHHTAPALVPHSGSSSPHLACWTALASVPHCFHGTPWSWVGRTDRLDRSVTVLACR